MSSCLPKKCDEEEEETVTAVVVVLTVSRVCFCACVADRKRTCGPHLSDEESHSLLDQLALPRFLPSQA